MGNVSTDQWNVDRGLITLGSFRKERIVGYIVIVLRTIAGHGCLPYGWGTQATGACATAGVRRPRVPALRLGYAGHGCYGWDTQATGACATELGYAGHGCLPYGVLINPSKLDLTTLCGHGRR